MRVRRQLVWWSVLGLVLASAAPARAAAGALDTTFSGDGIKLVANVTVAASVVQPDGAVVVVGMRTGATPGPIAMRYTASGVLDPTFDGDGRATLRVTPADVALQADGKIVVAGTIVDYNEPIVVERLTRTGGRDTTFSGDGLSVAYFDDPWQGDNDSLFVAGVVIDSSGRITVAVESLEYPRNYDRWVSLLVQWEPNGTRRLGFGVDGVAWARRCDEVGGLAVQADRKLVVVGLGADDEPIVAGYTYDPCVTRLHPNGSLDSAFGTNGFTPFPTLGNGTGRAPAISPRTGSIAFSVVGWDLTSTTIVRVLADGSPDPSFGTAGTTSIDLATLDAWRGDLTLQGNRVVVVGTARPGAADLSAWAIARLTGAGLLDATFGTGGLVTLDVSAGDDSPRSVSVRSGKIVVAGTTSQGSAVARFLG